MDLSPLFSSDGIRTQLLGARCEGCGAVSFPSRIVCDRCAGRTFAPYELSGTGQLRSVTDVPIPPAGFDGPIRVGVVELNEGPAVFAFIVDDAVAGQPVAAHPAPVKDGQPAFAFRSAS